MLYTEEMVRQNLRNREGKRVFYLGKGDTLTPGARDWLQRERISILPAETAKPSEYRLLNGAVLHEKPEQMTHLNGDFLVPKPTRGFNFEVRWIRWKRNCCYAAFGVRGSFARILERFSPLRG